MKGNPQEGAADAGPLDPHDPGSGSRSVPAWAIQAVWWTAGLFRLVFLTVMHPAGKFIYSDMNTYVQHAIVLAHHQSETIFDSIYPPGNAIYLAILYSLDNSWNLAYIVQWLFSLGIMWLIWRIALLLYGERVAFIALLIAAVYFPFIHYAGFFLSENPFTFFMLLAVWLFLQAAARRGGRVAGFVAGLAGLAVGIDCSFKTTVLGPVLLLGIFYSVYAFRYPPTHYWRIAICAVIGVVIPLIPLSIRCTNLTEGNYCLVSTNGPMNILQGHYGKVSLFTWTDSQRNITFVGGSPTVFLDGYNTPVNLNWGAYETGKNMALAREWISQHPSEALKLSLTNISDLFVARTFWPYSDWNGVSFGWWSQLFSWVFVFPAALAWLIVRGKAMALIRKDSYGEWVLLCPLIGIAGMVFIAEGEIRYRIPFDGFLIILASCSYASLFRRMRRIRVPFRTHKV